MSYYSWQKLDSSQDSLLHTRLNFTPSKQDHHLKAKTENVRVARDVLGSWKALYSPHSLVIIDLHVSYLHPWGGNSSNAAQSSQAKHAWVFRMFLSPPSLLLTWEPPRISPILSRPLQNWFLIHWCCAPGCVQCWTLTEWLLLFAAVYTRLAGPGKFYGCILSLTSVLPQEFRS